MEHHQPTDPEKVPQSTESLGTVRNDSESFRNVPHGSEAFGKVPRDSESFRSIPKVSERNENHSLTVREAARLFESAGVARTERSIVNWCQPNRQGISRLDSYFDPNERKYYITPQSVESAIAEEKARAEKNNPASEPLGNVPKPAESAKQAIPKRSESHELDKDTIKELEQKVMDLTVLNKGKDFFIDQLQKERGNFLDQLLAASHRVGELESDNRVLRLAPSNPEGKN